MPRKSPQKSTPKVDEPAGLTGTLSATEIEILCWHFADGHSFAEIAAWMNVSRQMVHKRVKRACAKLTKAGMSLPTMPKHNGQRRRTIHLGNDPTLLDAIQQGEMPDMIVDKGKKPCPPEE